MQRPTGVTIIAILFGAAGLYLWIVGAVQLLSPGTISLMAGKQFMYGLELAGPFMASTDRRGLCAHWMGIVSSAEMVAMGRDDRDGYRHRMACAEDLNGGTWRSSVLVRIPDCSARGFGVVLVASAERRGQLRGEILATDLHGLSQIKFNCFLIGEYPRNPWRSFSVSLLLVLFLPRVC